jgi:PAS domain S-box-containing protein
MAATFSLSVTTANNLGIGLFRYSLLPVEKFVFANSACLHIFGYPSKKAFQNQLFEHFFNDPDDARRLFSELEEHGRVKFFEAMGRNYRGKPVWIAITATLITDDSEEYFEGIIEDITNFKDTKDKLAHEIDFFQNFLDAMPDAIYFKDNKNRLTRVNQFYARGFGSSPEKLIGKSDFDFFPKDQARLMFEDDKKIIKTGKPIVGKIEKTLLPNGTWNQVITTKVPMHNIKGKIIGTMGVTRDMTAHANLEHERSSMIMNALTVLGKALEMRDPYTFSHTRYVAVIAQEIARALGFSEIRMMEIKLAAELHDLGKIAIPLDILIKPGRLSNLEFQLVQKHVENCYDLIKDIQFPFPLAEIIYQHHERLDGSGYPRGLKGETILQEAKILAVSDVLEAMTSHRPYREALGIQVAQAELKRGRGIKYDPEIVDTALQIIHHHRGKAFWQNGNNPVSN